MKRHYKKSDKDVRCALWLAYDKRDAYSNEIIKYREMQVDHIIPQHVFDNDDKKMEVFSKLGLDSDFEMDSLDNFAPTCPLQIGKRAIPLTMLRLQPH